MNNIPVSTTDFAAEALLALTLSSSPESPEIIRSRPIYSKPSLKEYFENCRSAIARGDFSAVRSIAQVAIVDYPEKALFYGLYGRAQTLLNDYVSAEISFKIALGKSNLNEEIGQYHGFLGDLYRLTGRVEEAKGELLKSLQFQPSSIFVLKSLANVYYLLDNFDEGIETINQVFQKRSNDAYSYKMRGMLFFSKGLDLYAAEDFYQAYKISPQSYTVNVGLGMTYRKLNMNDDAIKHLRYADYLQPNTPLILEALRNLIATKKLQGI